MITTILRKFARKFRRQPDMLDVCKCGHLFEEHDWGAYSNLRTRYTSACLVVECQGYGDKLYCNDFHRMRVN